MNYQYTTSGSLQPMSASISLPPISSIDFHAQQIQRTSPDVVQPLPPPPPAAPRVLPPLPYPYAVRPAPPPPPPMVHDYMHARPIYSGMPSPYQHMPGRMPLPSTSDPNLIVAPTRHKAKEVKRRTKTGCLTCRKRRIKCDEGRPECRNCMKSKRVCQGYDPVFQAQGPHSIHPAPPVSSAPVHNSGSVPTSTSINQQSRRFVATPISPPVSNHSSTVVNNSPRDHQEYPFPRPPEQVLPHLNQPYHLDGIAQPGYPSYPTPGRLMADIEPHLASRTIESICTIPGTRIPSIPPIPPDSIPNEDEIRRWYDNNFAPSLDKLLDSGSSKWFATRGFKLLFNDRSRLGSVLAYLTLVSNHGNNPSTDNASLASQEARVTWMLLELCVRSDQDGGEEADKLARRCQALGAILTAQPLTNPTASLADFVHQDETEPETKMGAFERQVARRADEFWKLVEKAAANQAPDGSGVSLTALRQIQPYRDQQENRDIIYSIMLLGSTQAGQSELSSEQGLVRTFLQNEARGRATNLVFSTLSGMALRAFPS